MKKIEEKLYKDGYHNIVGLDEAGRGCLAGPLVVAAVIFPKDYVNLEIKDSKTLSSKKRQELFEIIKAKATAFTYKVYDAEYVTLHNPKQGSIKGMLECLNTLQAKWDYAIVDGEDLKLENSLKVIKGDRLSQTIAAASIIAKTIRDLEIEKMHQEMPEFDFINNQGYGTKKHFKFLKEYGVTKYHREKYKQVAVELAKNNVYQSKK